MTLRSKMIKKYREHKMKIYTYELILSFGNMIDSIFHDIELFPLYLKDFMFDWVNYELYKIWYDEKKWRLTK